ncbi:MAG: hypothetical protein ACTSXK_05125 [Promethearchaeota archaeon]
MMSIKCIICETPVDLESFSRFMCPTCGYINDMLENIPKQEYGFYVVHEKQIAVLPISLEYFGMVYLKKPIQFIMILKLRI